MGHLNNKYTSVFIKLILIFQSVAINVNVITGLIIFSVIGNSLVLYNLMLGKDSLGKKRSKTIFLHITLADVMVTMFPMAGIINVKFTI